MTRQSIQDRCLDRINLGCGPNPPGSWLNIDGSWNAWLSNHVLLHKALSSIGILKRDHRGAKWNSGTLIHDLTKPLPFASGTVGNIYASHVLEHLYREDGRRLLRECWRVLRPSGTCRIVVPDLRSMVMRYLSEKNGNGPESSKGAAAESLNEALAFRDPSPPGGNILLRFYYLSKDFHHHKWMYDSELLVQSMEAAGFVDVRQRGYLDSDISGIEEVEQATRVVNGAGICVEGKMPQQ